MDELLCMMAHVPSDGFRIVNGKGETLAITMLTPSTVALDAPGESFTEKLRWVIETGQVIPVERYGL